MGLNFKKGRIPNDIKRHAEKMVDEHGALAYHYACYDTAFGMDYPRKAQDFQLIDCIVRILKERKLW